MIKTKLLLSLLLLFVTADLLSQPFISFSEKNLNYSDRRVNSISGQIFNITNTGNQPLIINSVSFSSSRFRLDAFEAAFPLTLNPQQTVKLRIWFSPNSASVFNDAAIFSTNAANNSTAKILLSGRGVNVTPNLGDIIWEGTIPDNPCTSLDDFQPKSIKEIPDVNGDGKADIVVATENYWTICYNGNASGSADIIWRFNTCFGTNNTGSVDWEDAMQIMDDINNDGKKEVVIGTGGGNENVYVLSGATGNILWEYGDPIPTNNYTGDINGLRVDKDFNNDGRKDVLVSATGEGATHPGRHSIICLNGLNGQELFVTVIQSEFTHDVATLNLGGAIAFASNGGPYGVKGVNNSGALQWSYSASSTVWSTKQIPDINNDGNTDVVGLYGFAGGIFALSGSNGQQLWTNSLGSSNNGTVEVIGDKDHNGFPDLIFSAPQTAFRIDSKNNQIFWSRPFSSSYIRDAGSLGDVSGDSIDECLFSTQQPGKVFVLDGNNGNILFEYLFGTSIQQRADRVNALTSIDSNTANEFVACSRDGRIKCFSGGSGTILGISSGSGEIPGKFALYQNYPNPFNPVTKIKFDIPARTNVPVQLKVFDVLGKEVTVLVNEVLPAGIHTAEWNAENFASGVYFYELKAGDFSDIKKMIVVK